MTCTICGTHIYDEVMLIDSRDDLPICLECDNEETISDWKEEND